MAEPKSIRFGNFEVDLDGWVLRHNGKRIALQKKPFQILRLLLNRPGELVTRAELAHELWPELHVSYDRCLNTAVNVLRNALNDPARESPYIETRPGLGYRFCGSLSVYAHEPELAMGYYFLHRFSFEGVTRSRACFYSALRERDRQGSGQVGMANIEILTAMCGYASTREASDRALNYARAAMATNDVSAAAQSAIVVASALRDGNHDAAITAGPSQNVPSRIWLADFLCFNGRTREAVEHLEAAQQANPISLLIRSKLSLAHYLAGNYEAAVKQAWSALSLEPACAEAQYALALAYQQLGQLDDAITEFENAVRCSGGGSAAALAGLCQPLAQGGYLDQAFGAATQLSGLARSGYVSNCWQALTQLACNESEAAERSLASAAEANDFLLGFVRLDPRFRQSNAKMAESALPPLACHAASS